MKLSWIINKIGDMDVELIEGGIKFDDGNSIHDLSIEDQIRYYDEQGGLFYTLEWDEDTDFNLGLIRHLLRKHEEYCAVDAIITQENMKLILKGARFTCVDISYYQGNIVRTPYDKFALMFFGSGEKTFVLDIMLSPDALIRANKRLEEMLSL